MEEHQDIHCYREQITNIANAINMWSSDEDNLPEGLIEYCTRYLHQMAASPTISQAIERAVKLANHVNLDSGCKRGKKNAPCMQLQTMKL